MNRSIAVGAVGFAVLATMAGGGIWMMRQAEQREFAAAEESRLQRAMLAQLKESVSALARRSIEPSVDCAESTAAGATLQQAGLDAAAQKAVARQTEQAATEAEAKVLPSDASLEAFAEGEELVGHAIAAKRWTDADAESLRDVAGHMVSDQQIELIRRLSVAINEGVVSMQTRGPLF